MRTRPAVLPWLLLAPATLFLLAVFVRPFAITFADSLSGGDGFLGHYREVLGSVLLRRAMRVTLELAVWTTVVCVLAGYLIAYRLSTMSAARARILLLVILFPALTAVLARLYGWTIVLGRRGPINDWLTKSGLTEDPLPLVFTRSAAILGLVHVLLPVAVFILYTAIRRLDPALGDAARSLGAGWWTTFRRITLPATLPAAAAAAVLVFALSIGNYVTPSTMGGPREYTVPLEVLRRATVRDWGEAVASGAVLLLATALLFAVTLRLIRMPTNAGPVRPPGLRATPGPPVERVVLNAVTAVAILFFVTPLLVVFPISVTPSSYFRFPPGGFSLRWYEDFFGDGAWRDAGWLSLRLAVTTTVVATGFSLLAAFATTRYLRRGATAFRLLFIAPLIVPLVITGTAVLYVVDELDIEGTFEGILLGHIVLALPFAYLVIESALRGYDTSLEDAAVTLGAGRARAFRAVTLPAIAPALFAAAAFAFIASWDDVVIARFLSGSVGLQTLPIRMYMFMSTQIRPTIAAISSLLITTLFVALLAWEAWRAVRRRRVA